VTAIACGELPDPVAQGFVNESPVGARRTPRAIVFDGTLAVSNANTGAGSKSLTLMPGNQGYQIRVSGYITRKRIPDGSEFQFGPYGQGGCGSSTIKVWDYRGLRAASAFGGDCSSYNYQRYEWVAVANLATAVTIERDGGTTTCSPQWSLNPCFVYSGSQTISIIPVNDTNLPTVAVSADRGQVTVGDTVTFTATLGPPGQPTTVSSWEWINDSAVVPWDSVQSPAVVCAGTTCRYAPTRSGSMKVTATLRGATASASVAIDVGCLFPIGASNSPFIQPFLSLLNDRAVRDSMNVLYHLSGAAQVPATPASQRREHGMFVHTNATGNMVIQMVRTNQNSLDDGPCAIVMSPSPPAGYTTRLQMHVHPFNLGDAAPCLIQRGFPELWRYRRGDTGQIQSNSDWATLFATPGTPLGIVVDRTYVAAMQMVAGASVTFGPQRNNPLTGALEDTYVVSGYSAANQMQFRRNSGACAWPGRGTE
jgi:hypothetical protein